MQIDKHEFLTETELSAHFGLAVLLSFGTGVSAAAQHSCGLALAALDIAVARWRRG